MYTSSNLMSHPNITLKQHVEEVEKIALEIHRRKGGLQELEVLISNICKSHDFGKGTTYFQNYLNNQHCNQKFLKNHSLLSALYAYYIMPENYKLYGYLIVKNHHSNINDLKDEVTIDENLYQINCQINDIELYTKDALIEIYGENINGFIKKIKDGNLFNELDDAYLDLEDFSIDDYMMISYLYSILLTSDKTHLIRGKCFVNENKFEYTLVEKYINQLINKTDPRDKNNVFNTRQNIFKNLKQSLKKINDNDKLLSIHLPTGSGKTLLAYYTAMYLASNKQKRGIQTQIIYCLPYLSIIDQNFNVLEDIYKTYSEYKTSDLLKYHSQSEVEYDNYQNYDARFLMDNWQSLFVTTTFVQLFNTIFKFGMNKIVQRFYNLRNAVVILDEVQVIKLEYYQIIRDFLSNLSEKYNTTFILVTATLPYLIPTKSLIINSNQYFYALSRIKIYSFINTPYTIEEYLKIVNDDIVKNRDKSFLLVLNTIKVAKYVYNNIKYIGNRKKILLTTEIYPARRLELIDEIKESKNKYIVISTQLIEAGVDIDMDIIYRDLAPFDSIQQTAGRANRNGSNQCGIVNVVKLRDDLVYILYPAFLLDITERLLKAKNQFTENEFYELSQKYYEEVQAKLSDSSSRKLYNNLNNTAFRYFRDSFKLIDEENKEDIFVIIDEISNENIHRLENNSIANTELLNIFKKLNQYKISIYVNKLKQLSYKTINKYNIKYITDKDYDVEIGIKE